MFYEDFDDICVKQEEPDAIGKGLAEINMIDRLGRLRISKGKERVAQSIRNIIDTPIGSRFFLPTFGSKVHQLLYEPNDFILRDLMSLYIREAVKTWEKRATIEDVLVDTDTDPRVCYVQILYRIHGINTVESMEYSFRREATE